MDGKKENVIASHSEWYFGTQADDNGKEGQCLGAHYGEPTYSMMKNRDIYNRDKFEPFNPEDSDSKELENWSKKQREKK